MKTSGSPGVVTCLQKVDFRLNVILNLKLKDFTLACSISCVSLCLFLFQMYLTCGSQSLQRVLCPQKVKRSPLQSPSSSLTFRANLD